MFKHHPDGRIYIGSLSMTLDDWLLDEPDYPALPAGFIGREFIAGERHYIHTDTTAVPLGLYDPVVAGYVEAEEAYQRAAAVRRRMRIDGFEPVGLPDMRARRVACEFYVDDELHAELKTAEPSNYLAFVQDGTDILVYMREDAPAGTESVLAASVAAHTPAFLSLNQYTLKNDGLDEVVVTVYAPKSAEGDTVYLTIDGENFGEVMLDATLHGSVAIVTLDPAGTRFELDVLGLACTSRFVEVISG